MGYLPHTVKPAPGTAAEHVMLHGLESLRSIPLRCGDEVRYLTDKLIDEALELYADDMGRIWRMSFYGGTTRNAEMVSWIYLNSVTLETNP